VNSLFSCGLPAHLRKPALGSAAPHRSSHSPSTIGSYTHPQDREEDCSDKFVPADDTRIFLSETSTRSSQWQTGTHLHRRIPSRETIHADNPN
jgi:hypothetical protein